VIGTRSGQIYESQGNDGGRQDADLPAMQCIYLDYNGNTPVSPAAAVREILRKVKWTAASMLWP